MIDKKVFLGRRGVMEKHKRITLTDEFELLRHQVGALILLPCGIITRDEFKDVT